jgi:hypothetical protein
MGGKHDHRRPLTDCTVRSHVIVVLAPKFDLCRGVVKVQEPMLVARARPAVAMSVPGTSRHFAAPQNLSPIGPTTDKGRHRG